TMGVPLAWYARDLVKRKLWKLMFLVMVVATLPAIVMTFSRGAALSLAAVMVLMSFRAKRKTGMILLFAFVVGGAVYMVRESYINRLSTVKVNPTESSAALRGLYMKVAFRMWTDHPLFGVGFGTLNEMELMNHYTEISAIHGAQVIHNTWMQMLCDSGIFAYLLYVITLLGTVLWLQTSIRRMNKEHPSL